MMYVLSMGHNYFRDFDSHIPASMKDVQNNSPFVDVNRQAHEALFSSSPQLEDVDSRREQASVLIGIRICQQLTGGPVCVMPQKAH